MFIASIDGIKFTAKDIEDAVEKIGEIVKEKGLMLDGQHIVDSAIHLKCKSHEEWMILSETFT